MDSLCFNRYPPEAFAFVSGSLATAVHDVHGSATRAHMVLNSIMHANGLTLEEFIQHYLANHLDEFVSKLVEEIGGLDALNRHVSGTDLCHTLKRLAIERWGFLARTVLESWKITQTLDFGLIVFEMVEKGHLSKEPEDSLDDFDGAYDFVDFDTDFLLKKSWDEEA